jgi:Domain of unknown function (DUF4383)
MREPHPFHRWATACRRRHEVTTSGRPCSSTQQRSSERQYEAPVGVLGLFILDSGVNILALNGADNGLHLVSGAVLLLVGLIADRERR